MSMSSEPTSSRLYTLSTATALLPTVTPILEQLRTDYQSLADLKDELTAQVASLGANGMVIVAHRSETQIKDTSVRMQRGFGELSKLGIEVKNIEWGLIDFLAEHEGRLVYLCWKLGEPAIEYWHDIEAGFAGRQPLDETF